MCYTYVCISIFTCISIHICIYIYICVRMCIKYINVYCCCYYYFLFAIIRFIFSITIIIILTIIVIITIISIIISSITMNMITIIIIVAVILTIVTTITIIIFAIMHYYCCYYYCYCCCCCCCCCCCGEYTKTGFGPGFFRIYMARARPPTPPRPKRQRDERGSSSQNYTWTGDWWGQDWGAWSWQDTLWWEHQDSAAAATEANQPEMEAQQTDIVQDAVWQRDQMEISTDEEECSREIPAPTATGAMEGGVRIDPTELFDAPLTASDLPEDSSRAEKLSKMMTAALRHKPGDFQIELQPDGFVRLETLAQSAPFCRLGATSRMLAAVVRSISKKRFMFTMRRGDIHVAATHGHSEGVLITQDTLVEISPSRAPEFAYHATKFSHWHGILSQGLLKMGRTHVFNWQCNPRSKRVYVVAKTY